MTDWYHGTVVDLDDGADLYPAVVVGFSPHDDGDDHPDAVAHRAAAGQFVWVTDDLVDAAYYAAVAAAVTTRPDTAPLIVAVDCDPEPGGFDDGHRCAAATVRRRLSRDECLAAARAAAEREPDPDWILQQWGLTG